MAMQEVAGMAPWKGRGGPGVALEVDGGSLGVPPALRKASSEILNDTPQYSRRHTPLSSFSLIHLFPFPFFFFKFYWEQPWSLVTRCIHATMA